MVKCPTIITDLTVKCFADFAEIFADCKFHKINFVFIIMYGVIFYECYTGGLEVSQV